MEYYAKSQNPQGHQETVKEHLQKVAALAREYGEVLGLEEPAELEGQIRDFGKYTESFQDVLNGTRTGIDHAISGACFLECCYRGKLGSRPVIEAVNGHHDGLVAYDMIKAELHAIADERRQAHGNAGKTSSIENAAQLKEANEAFRKDFPDFRLPKLPAPPAAELESMLYTRLLFSCLVDADYTASAMNDDNAYLAHAEDSCFDPLILLEKLYAYCRDIRQASTADKTLNRYRDQVFKQCGNTGDAPEGLYTLTAPTGTGKTLALLHFALRHCLKHGKKQIIIVLPFLTLAEQNADTYSKIIPNVLVDHSQGDLPEEARELAARWSAPVIITTSVRFFEALFSDRPTVCRKLHNIAGSIIELVRSLLVRFFGITKYASEFFEPTNNIGVSEELTVKANSNINTFSYHEGSRKVQIKLSSIHAVKGRTHLATLVLDTYWYKRNLKSIMPWLRNIASKSPSERDAKRLKCHYVAITRAKGLICLAAPKSSISDKDKTNLIKAGWNITEL